MSASQHLGKPPRDPFTAFIGALCLVAFFWPLVLLWMGLKTRAGLATLVAVILMYVWIGAYVVYTVIFWLMLASLASLVVWRLARPADYERIADWRVRALWRKHMLYRRKWSETMRNHSLHVVRAKRRDKVPAFVKFKATPYVDHILVRPAKGSIKEFQGHAADFATAFNAERCRIRKHPTRHDRFWLTFPQVDRLATPIEPPPISEDVDLTRVTVGLTEDGDLLRLRILGRHLLVTGQVGSGKSILLWSILWSIAPLIRDGLVEIHAIDPKGGMELGPGKPLYARYAYRDADEMVQVIEDVLARMDRRMAWCEERDIREHVPTKEEPFILLVIDEGAVLSLLANTPDTKKNLERWQILLLSQGRAPGVGLISCYQVPSKAMIDGPLRDLYPQRVQHRSLEPRHADMTLGPGARERGAETEVLRLPGMFFCTIDGEIELTMGRSFHIRNEHIRHLVQNYAPAKSPGERLRSVLAGEIQNAEVVLTPEQQADKAGALESMRRGKRP